MRLRPAAILLAPVLLVLCAPCFPSSNNFARKAVPDAPLLAPDPSMPLGEKLTYDIFWLGFPVGTGEVWVKEKTVVDGREAYHVVGTARGNGFLGGIYPVQDEAHSWIDAETLRSLRFSKKIREGPNRADEKTDFRPPAHDAFSAFYWARRQALEPGRTVSTVLTTGKKEWGLDVDVVRRERKSLRGHGKVDAIVVEPRLLVDGKPDTRGRAWLHLRNDSRRTPVYVSFKTRFGPVTGVLRPH
ncbi:MAG TPA: DUF3108 domain-containing protein [Candidatus Eisenbacteria bacterium]|nr:DUF3108 domain-containing protein [Candidatus Eisenbacteria bacterium]